jgi:serine/threonine-protein kinase
MPETGRTNDDTPEPMIGSYRLVESLGAGGMSSVFRAVHAESGLEVAVKILPRNLARNRTLLQRFLREAKSAEALEHPNIVAIYDRGVDDGRYYLVLEFIPGGDLHDRVRASGPLQVDDALEVIRAVAEGLRFAAGRGLIHRDIKPANLLITPEGRVKIADLGLALQAADEDERVTREGTTVGTVDYMAPEQARDSRATGVRSDIYSLGCTFFFLLTGQPPYPGGDVTDKLSRHFTSPPPDPREFRFDIPDGLPAVLRKMMAKRPERRYGDYDELIAALDDLRAESASQSGPVETLDALIDDEDDPEGLDGLPASIPLAGAGPQPPADSAPLYALVDDDDEPPASDPNRLFALVDDFDDEDPDDPSSVSDAFRPLTLPEPPARPREGDTPRYGKVSLADLARLDEPVGGGSRLGSSVTPSPTPASLTPEKGTPLVSVGGDDVDDGGMPGQVSFGSGGGMTAAEKSWLTALVLGGLGLIVLVIALDQLFRGTWWSSTERAVDDEVVSTAPADPGTANPEPPGLPPPKPTPPTKKAEPPAIAEATPKGPVAPAPPPQPTRWVEPIDLERRYVPETDYGTGIEARYRPDWAAVDVPNRLPGKLESVRRVPDPRDPEQKTSIRLALEVIGAGTVEVVDNGPFFDEDLWFAGDSRLVKARAGFRPIICLAAPKPLANAQQQAVVDLGNRSLILEGLDLIVDAKDLPPGQSALFHVQGGALTLSDCTVTVINRGSRPFSVVRTGQADRPSKVRLERTWVRGDFSEVVDLDLGSADVVVSRSVLVNGHGSAMMSAGSETADRRVYVTRSILATSGPAFEMADPPRGARPKALTVRALGSTFAHLQAQGRTSLILWRGAGAGATDMVNWQGDANEFTGWDDFLSVGHAHNVRVANLNAARAIWPGTDPASRELAGACAIPQAADRAVPEHLRGIAANRLDVLTRVAAPSPMTQEKSLEAFRRPVVPGLTTPTGVLLNVGNQGPAPPAGAAPENVPPASQAWTALKIPGARELIFDAEAAPLAGDLGRFLAESIKVGDTLVRVRVTGTGQHPCSPVKLPDGVSLDVIVSPDPSGRTPSWSPAITKDAEALIDVRSGSLALTGVNLSRDGSSRPRWLLRVTGGHLVLRRCQLISRGATEAGGGGLIAFEALGSQPLSAPALGPDGPFDIPVDRPTCRLTESVLITGGEALSAEVGRGLVALWQCAVVSGTTAFNLRPGKVAMHRFEADLWLCRCTVAAERTFVSLGPWRGSEPGPDRPWLVATSQCAFLGRFQGAATESVLLRTDAEAFARGCLSWQADGDGFEVPHFVAAGEPAPQDGRRPDVTRQWCALWGPAHIKRVAGPHAQRVSTLCTVVPLRPGAVQLGDLALEPSAATKDLGVDLSRLGIAPTARAARLP